MKRVFLLLYFIYHLYIHVEQRDMAIEKGGFRVCARARHKAWSMVTDFSLLLLTFRHFFFIFYSYIKSGDYKKKWGALSWQNVTKKRLELGFHVSRWGWERGWKWKKPGRGKKRKKHGTWSALRLGRNHFTHTQHLAIVSLWWLKYFITLVIYNDDKML